MVFTENASSTIGGGDEYYEFVEFNDSSGDLDRYLFSANLVYFLKSPFNTCNLSKSIHHTTRIDIA